MVRRSGCARLNRERMCSGTSSDCPRSIAPAAPATNVRDPKRQNSARRRIVASAHRLFGIGQCSDDDHHQANLLPCRKVPQPVAVIPRRRSWPANRSETLATLMSRSGTVTLGRTRAFLRGNVCQLRRGLADWDASLGHFAATQSLAVQTSVSFIRLRLQDDWTTLAKEKALVFRSIFCGWRFP